MPISPRLKQIVDALPLSLGMRILEIGCGPGAAAREIANVVGDQGFVLGIDRSRKAIDQALTGSVYEIEVGKLAFECIAVEDFELGQHAPFDIALAVRVGTLDGRHPNKEKQALERIKAALTPEGSLFIDQGTTVREVKLPQARH